MVDQSDKLVSQAARAMGLTESALHKWVKQHQNQMQRTFVNGIDLLLATPHPGDR